MKSQNAIEFTVVLGIAIVFFLVVSLFIASRTVDIQSDRSALYAQIIANNVQQEIDIAKQLEDGYTRSFTLDSEYGGKTFNLTLFQGREIRVTSEDGVEAVKFLPQYIVGNISIGYNEIMKRAGIIAFCAGGCNGTFPINLSGSFLCAPQEGLWVACDPKYDDYFEGVRIKCFQTSAVNASLTIQHRDSGAVALNVTTLTTFGDFMHFDDEFTVDKSGIWDVSLVCYDGSGAPYAPYTVEWNIPYGRLVASFSSFAYGTCTNNNCTADQNFYPVYDISCIGGDCGNVSVILDPEEQ